MCGLGLCRTKKKWRGPVQYEDPSGDFMMLPTDMVRNFVRTCHAAVNAAPA